MGKQIVYRCQLCKYYYGYRMCEAFHQELIPKDIFAGDNDHSKPLPVQSNEIVFEQNKK